MKFFKRFLMGLVVIGILTLFGVGLLSLLGVWVILLPAIVLAMVCYMVYDLGKGIIG